MTVTGLAKGAIKRDWKAEDVPTPAPDPDTSRKPSAFLKWRHHPEQSLPQESLLTCCEISVEAPNWHCHPCIFLTSMSKSAVHGARQRHHTNMQHAPKCAAADTRNKTLHTQFPECSILT